MFQNVDKSIMGIRMYGNNGWSKVQEDSQGSKSRIQELKEKKDKDPLDCEEKAEIADEILEKQPVETQNKILNNSLDKILVSHRHTRTFLFMLSGPFFILFTLVKYVIKGGVFYYIYYKNKKLKES